MNTSGFLRGNKGWFTEKEAKIAVTRVIRDDLSKTEQNVPITREDVKMALCDSKLWVNIIY